MQVWAADDEALMLEALTEAIAQAIPQAQISTFQKASKLLEYAETHTADLVFLDIQMRGTDGLALAERLRIKQPDLNVIFVTGYGSYALRAMQLRASGYLMKPVTCEKILEELASLRFPLTDKTDRLYVRCFGYFEVFYREKPLKFARARTKELFAYLIDRRGSMCTAEEMIVALWEDDEELFKRKNQLRVCTNDLRNTLRQCGQEAVLLRASNQWAVQTELVSCDYYQLLRADAQAVQAYHGQYMQQYSWAEQTAGMLLYRYAK